MPPYRKPNIDEILRKHSAKIENQMKTSSVGDSNYSSQYIKFKNEMAPEFTRYERWCKSLGNIIKLNVSEKDRAKI